MCDTPPELVDQANNLDSIVEDLRKIIVKMGSYKKLYNVTDAELTYDLFMILDVTVEL